VIPRNREIYQSRRLLANAFGVASAKADQLA